MQCTTTHHVQDVLSVHDHMHACHVNMNWFFGDSA